MKTAVIAAPAGGHDRQRIRRRGKLTSVARASTTLSISCGNRLSCLFNQRMPLRIVRGVLFAEHRRQSGGLRLVRR
jgi:hypothetical protein